MECTKKGIDITSEVWTGYCRSCKAEFKATRKELKGMLLTQEVVPCVTDPKQSYILTECPECNTDESLIMRPPEPDLHIPFHQQDTEQLTFFSK